MINPFARLLFPLGLILAICSCAPVTIDSNPSGATVYSADGTTELGTTPFDTRIFVSEKNFLLRKDRYFEEPVILNYDSDRYVDLKFRPTPVLVYSKPNAEIYPVDSETSIGTTPMKVAVANKVATYTLKAADYYDQDISVSIDAPDPLVVELARRPIVTLSAEPEGVEVYENDVRIGMAPIREEILTPRTFELRKENYFTQSGTLTGAPPYEIHTVLRPFPVIAVSAVPSDAQISRAGVLIGNGSVELPVGDTIELEVRADRYYTQSVTLTPDSPAQLDVELKAMPYVMINSEPSGAEVFINGESIGMTPVEQLVEQETAIELRKESFVSQTATLTGKDASITLTLEIVHPTPEERAAEAAAKAAQAAAEKAAAEKAAAEKAAKQRNLMLAIGGIVAVIIAAVVVLLMKKKKK